MKYLRNIDLKNKNKCSKHKQKGDNLILKQKNNSKLIKIFISDSKILETFLKKFSGISLEKNKSKSYDLLTGI